MLNLFDQILPMVRRSIDCSPFWDTIDGDTPYQYCCIDLLNWYQYCSVNKLIAQHLTKSKKHHSLHDSCAKSWQSQKTLTASDSYIRASENG